MFEEIKNIKTGKKEIRNFGITFGIIFLVIAGFLFFKEKESYQLFFYLAGSFFCCGFIAPAILKPIYLVWMIFAVVLGWIMTRLVLSVLYFLIVTPIGLIPRLFGKQFLDLKWDKKTATYWNYRSEEDYHVDSDYKQF